MPTALALASKILQVHGGLESNIPWNHCYWKLMDEVRNDNEVESECVFNLEPLNPSPPPPPQAQDKIRLAALRKICRDTLTLYGVESNVPFTHEYWFAMNVIKSIERQPE